MSDEELLNRTEMAYDAGQHVPGYRDGVILVTISPKECYTGLVTLKEGDKLVGSFKARREGEEPRQSIYVNRDAEILNAENPHPHKQKAKLVQVVCYSHDVLAEDGDADSDAPWEIVSLNGYPTADEAPIDPFTLMHNHFGSDGGTTTGLTPEEFEIMLSRSFNYWKNKALLDG